jgi:hypothetical protein
MICEQPLSPRHQELRLVVELSIEEKVMGRGITACEHIAQP